MTHAPALGNPSRTKPVFIWHIAGPWVLLFAVSEWMKAMSSTQVARWGKRSLTIFPHCPYGLKFHLGPMTRPWFLCPPRPKVFTSMVLPSRS